MLYFNYLFKSINFNNQLTKLEIFLFDQLKMVDDFFYMGCQSIFDSHLVSRERERPTTHEHKNRKSPL